MSNTIAVNIVADVAKMRAGIDQANGMMAGFGKKMGAAAKFIGAAFIADRAFAFAKDVTKAASDTQQTLGATETVFGKFADTVEATSKRAATAYGLSANTYRENANVLGALLANQGVQASKLAGKTKELIGVGSDLAATFGGTTTEAVQALASAYKGEFDPLERYGISLKQSGINAELAARGQDKLTGAALKQAQQAAITDLVMKQSAKSLGAFGRESDTLAHQQQVLGAQWADMKSKIGTALIPVLTKLASWVNTTVIPALTRLGNWIKTHIGPTLEQLGEWITTKVVPGFKALAEYLSTKAKPVLAALGQVFEKDIKPALAEVAAKWKEWEPTITKVVGAVIKFVATYVSKVAPVVIKFAGPIIKTLIKGLVVSIDNTISLVKAFIKFGQGIKTAAGHVAAFSRKVGEHIGQAINYVKTIPTKIKQVFANAGQWLVDAGRRIINGLLDGIKSAVGKVKEELGKLTRLIPDWKGPAALDKRLLAPAGANIIDGLITGIAGRRGALRAEIADLNNDITSPTTAYTPGRPNSRNAGVSITLNVTAPVGASAVDIGRELTHYIDQYAALGGRRLAGAR
jgi:hypothetical protein